jgi:hypothetical protein
MKKEMNEANENIDSVLVSNFFIILDQESGYPTHFFFRSNHIKTKTFIEIKQLKKVKLKNILNEIIFQRIGAHFLNKKLKKE